MTTMRPGAHPCAGRKFAEFELHIQRGARIASPTCRCRRSAASLTTGATALTYDAASQIQQRRTIRTTVWGRVTAQPGQPLLGRRPRLTGVNGVFAGIQRSGQFDPRVDARGHAVFLPLAIGLTPIAAEWTADGAAQRYYVWTGRTTALAGGCAQSKAVCSFISTRSGATWALTTEPDSTDTYDSIPSAIAAHTDECAALHLFGAPWARGRKRSGALFQSAPAITTPRRPGCQPRAAVALSGRYGARTFPSSMP